MGKIAFVFPGQGAQVVGMGRDLYESSEAARHIFDMAGENVRELSFNGPADALNDTLNAQPCLFAMGLACAAALNERDVFADGVAGFSLGEVPAVVHAGVMTLEQGLDFVAFRARVMNECAARQKGGMYAVMKLSAESVESICTDIPGAYAVNYNCPGQTVVACSDESSADFQKSVTEQGGKALKLAVSGPFHSPFMDTAAEAVSNYLDGIAIKEPRLPVYANATAQTYGDPGLLLPRQINSPVLWQKTVEHMLNDGFDTFIETGAGKTLSGLIKKINRDARTLNVYDAASLDDTICFLKGRLDNA